MPEPVKISDLPLLSSVTANDILPIVDSGLTQTSKCTAAQIAAIGGGPPGDGTVTTTKLANGAVTAPKVGFTGPDKLISRTLSGAGEGTEIPCTGYARGLLASADAASARTYLDALQGLTNPTFTGNVTTSGSFVAGASGFHTFSGDTTTGLTRPAAGALGLVANGSERLRVTATGPLQTVFNGGSTLMASFGCRAFAYVYPPSNTVLSGAGNISSTTRLQTGSYLVNFATAMPDANYAAVCSASTATTQYSPSMGVVVQGQTTTTFNVVFVQEYGIAAGENWLRDPYYFSVAVFR